jgi:hypothetical protein
MKRSRKRGIGGAKTVGGAKLVEFMSEGAPSTSY